MFVIVLGVITWLILVLLGPEDVADPDASVIKAALALTSSPAHKGAKYHIVGELTDPANLDIAHIVGGDETRWIVGPELIGRITVQTCIQSGLSNIYQELLDFERNEIYFTNQPSLVGSATTIVTRGELRPLPGLTRLAVTTQQGDATNRRTLEALDPTAFDHIIVLADKTVDIQQTDSRTLVTLLHLRDIARHAGKDLNIVTEMLDDANRELAEVTEPDDFIVSDKLVALALAQISENGFLADVFDVLFSSASSVMYLHPAHDYVELGVEVDVTTLMEAARRRGETAIGFRQSAAAQDKAAGYGVHLNLHKAHRVTFRPRDQVIVLGARAAAQNTCAPISAGAARRFSISSSRRTRVSEAPAMSSEVQYSPT